MRNKFFPKLLYQAGSGRQWNSDSHMQTSQDLCLDNTGWNLRDNFPSRQFLCIVLVTMIQLTCVCHQVSHKFRHLDIWKYLETIQNICHEESWRFDFSRGKWKEVQHYGCKNSFTGNAGYRKSILEPLSIKRS